MYTKRVLRAGAKAGLAHDGIGPRWIITDARCRGRRRHTLAQEMIGERELVAGQANRFGRGTEQPAALIEGPAAALFEQIIELRGDDQSEVRAMCEMAEAPLV